MVGTCRGQQKIGSERGSRRIKAYQDGEFIGDAYYSGVLFRMNEGRPEDMASFYHRSTGAALLAGVLACFVPASNVCGAVCNPAPGEETELKTFTVKDGANPANKAVVDTGIPGSNPGKLYICGDTADIQMDATVSPLAARRQYVGWRIEKETGAGNLMDTPHANPNQGNVAVALLPPLFPGNESSLTVGAPEIRQFHVKAFCDGDKNGQKDAGEDFYYDTDGKVIEVQVAVLKVELFRDDACTKILDDWPAESGKPRSPKYVFGAENGIYVQVTGPAGLGNSYFTVKVTSEADTTGIHLHLHETSPGIYRNCNASGSEVLYLDKPTHVGTANDIYLKVLEEEVLPFTLKASGTEVCSTDVKTDRAEIGVEWQGEYATYDTSATLNTADDFTDGVYDHMGDANLVWAKEFNNGNLNSKEGHWDSGGDSSWADAVDFAVWCGHGHRVPAEGYMRFFVDLVGGVKQPANQLFWSEIDWGDLDVDWVILNTCNQLNGTDAELKVMANGVHLICGWRFWVCVGILCWPGRDLREARDAA
jgi:hypothetical protein